MTDTRTASGSRLEAESWLDDARTRDDGLGSRPESIACATAYALLAIAYSLAEVVAELKHARGCDRG